jgi:hypothetical protein
MAWLRRSFVMLMVCSVSWGCEGSFAPPPGTHRFEPPAAYRDAWASVEACSGLRGDMSRVRWYAIPGVASFPCGEGRECFGMWRSPHSIYVAEWASEMRFNNYLVVRHEMLHDLLGGGGAEGGSHPTVFSTCGLLST